MKYDVVIIGGGIVGLATAYQLLDRFPDRRVAVLEKESSVGFHQTGHNSGVLHSGIYYKPGSLKASNCREGKRTMEEFCREHAIDYDICGKVIVATSEQELPALENIYRRGQENGVACSLIDADELGELEPHAAGIRAIHVPEAGIVNFRQVSQKLAQLVQAAGSEVHLDSRVRQIRTQADRVAVSTSQQCYEGRYVINCAGLHCDRVTKLSGTRPEAKIVPFRGEYYELKPESHHFCRNLIYPVPDPSFPFLGVHFTRMIDGSVECGPNAVLAFAREGYRKTDINLRDLCESLAYPGFLKLAARYWRVGAGEMWRSVSKAAFVRALQKLIPEIRAKDLVPARAGVRAQAVARSGAMVDDFVIQHQDRLVHVGNAPSPAATSSLNIGKKIVSELASSW